MLSFVSSYITPWLKSHPTLTLMELLCHVIWCFPVSPTYPTYIGRKLSARHITALSTAFLVKVKLKTGLRQNFSKIQNFSNQKHRAISVSTLYVFGFWTFLHMPWQHAKLPCISFRSCEQNFQPSVRLDSAFPSVFTRHSKHTHQPQSSLKTPK